MLQRFKNDGQLPERFDIEQVLDAMYGPLHFLLMVRHGKLSPAYAESLAAMLIHGLAPRESDKSVNLRTELPADAGTRPLIRPQALLDTV